MDLFKSVLKILRRDPEVDSDDVLFVLYFSLPFFVIILLIAVTLVFGDGATFVRWILGK